MEGEEEHEEEEERKGKRMMGWWRSGLAHARVFILVLF